MKYWDEKFYWTHQCGVHWPDDYIGPDSMTWWIIEGSDGFTDVGLLTLPRPGFQKLTQTGRGGFRPLLTSLPLYPN